MKKECLKDLYVQKGILTKDGCRRKQCWLKFFDDESKKLFNEFSKQYRSEDEAWFCLLHNVEPYSCEVCGNLAKFTGRKKSKIPGYLTVCDNCSANASKQKLKQFKTTISSRTDDDKKHITEKRKHTNLVKYGDENYTLYGSAKFKNDLQAKYGSSTYNNREKAKQTCIERYGVPCNLCINSSERNKNIWNSKYDIIINKRIKTAQIKYGTDYPSQNSDVIDKIINSKKIKVSEIEKKYNCTQQRKLIKKYGQGWLHIGLDKLVIDGRTFIDNKDLTLIEKYINDEYHNNKKYSIKEKSLLEYIKSIYDGQILENNRSAIYLGNHKYYELDIFLPDINIAFEFNGTYWHSTIYKDKYYHQNKTKICYEHGIQLIHIYEYDWDINCEEIKNHIYELLNHKNCSMYNWIPVSDYGNYILTEPVLITYDKLQIYNEGIFKNIK